MLRVALLAADTELSHITKLFVLSPLSPLLPCSQELRKGIFAKQVEVEKLKVGGVI